MRNSERAIARKRHGTPSSPAIIIPPAWLSCSRSLIPRLGGGGLYEVRRQGRAGGRGSGEREKDAPSFSLLALSILKRLTHPLIVSSRLLVSASRLASRSFSTCLLISQSLSRSSSRLIVPRFVPSSRLASRHACRARLASRSRHGTVCGTVGGGHISIMIVSGLC